MEGIIQGRIQEVERLHDCNSRCEVKEEKNRDNKSDTDGDNYREGQNNQ